jgi:hypothetical protein
VITDRQLQHRAYLASPVWKAKRGEALAFYGCVCNRCKEHGTDVHHKTYDRVGGGELMEDLEVMCRECHKAHHEAERFTSRPRGIRTIHRRAIFGRLTPKHIGILQDEFNLTGKSLFVEINYGPTELADRAAQLLGCEFAWGKQPRSVGSELLCFKENDTSNIVCQNLNKEPLGNSILLAKKKKLAETQFIVQFLFILIRGHKEPTL